MLPTSGVNSLQYCKTVTKTLGFKMAANVMKIWIDLRVRIKMGVRIRMGVRVRLLFTVFLMVTILKT